MPPQGIELTPRSEILSFEEIYLVAQAAASLGINKLRLTGGEPLVRSALVELVEMLSHIEGVDDLSLTTNGMLLSHYAIALKRAGLKRVNVSLDSLQGEKFQRITRLGRLEQVLEGIAAAQEAGLHPLKLNVVLLRGINDDEILDFARRTIEDGWHVRFIELMPFGKEAKREWFVPASEIRGRIEEELGTLEPCSSSGGGPANYFRLPQAKGTIGFITPISEHFCFRCNRLRLTAEGKLRPCLLSDEEIDLREPLRRGISTEKLYHLIRQAVAAKPLGHRLAKGIAPKKQNMVQIGG
jgi:cyclic pyranopterin phosphate synthase